VGPSYALTSTDGIVLLSEEAYAVYPSSPLGKVTFEAGTIGDYTAYQPQFPVSFLTNQL